MAAELKLIGKVTVDEEGTDHHCQGLWLTAPEVEPRRFDVLSADIEALRHTGGRPGCATLESNGKAAKSHDDGCGENQNDHGENFDGNSEDECVWRQNR